MRCCALFVFDRVVTSGVIAFLMGQVAMSRAEDYLSNLGNRWVDPGNPGANSIGDVHTLFVEHPFTVRFFTGPGSGNYAKMHIGSPVTGTTNSPATHRFELDSATFEFIWGHAQSWSNVIVQLYQQVGRDSILVGNLGNPRVNPAPTQWPEAANPSFCTTYVDYHPLRQTLLQPASEYRLRVTVANDNPPNFGLLFCLSSNFVSSAGWRLGAMVTQDPWSGWEYMKVAIGATALEGTNTTPVSVSSLRLSVTRLGPNVVLSWPASAAPCQLYQTPGLGAGDWEPVFVQPVITNNNCLVTLPASGSGAYFRLQGQ